MCLNYFLSWAIYLFLLYNSFYQIRKILMKNVSIKITNKKNCFYSANGHVKVSYEHDGILMVQWWIWSIYIYFMMHLIWLLVRNFLQFIVKIDEGHCCIRLKGWIILNILWCWSFLNEHFFSNSGFTRIHKMKLHLFLFLETLIFAVILKE